MGRLEGKVALISGAARGQGEAEARLFVAEGAKVVLDDLAPRWHTNLVHSPRSCDNGAAAAASDGRTGGDERPRSFPLHH
jgi:NAD(P)-dependent dehydrogenase (short-subunit alcohol dehydrogenase family)